MSLHLNPGDSIFGERIAVQTKKIEAKGQVKIPGKAPQNRYKFSRFVYCVVDKPLRTVPNEKGPKSYFDTAEELQGDVISGRANSSDRIEILGGATGRHKAQSFRLFGDAYCVIDIPMQWKTKEASTPK